jgi:hypothetical protein
MKMFKHAMLMRFNLRTPAYVHSSNEDWLERRIELFESRMLPSLQAQTNQNFLCLPLMDLKRTPDQLRYRIEDWYCDIIKPSWFGEDWATDGLMYDSPPLWAICEEAVKKVTCDLITGDTLVTTRIDSDDALHEDFVDTIQQEVKSDTLEWLNIWYGWAEKDGLVYPDEHGKNMFISLVEPYFEDKPPLTVHREWHKRASNLAPIRQIAKDPDKRLWLRGIHSENKSSKLRGRNWEHEPRPLHELEGFIWGEK